MSNDTIIIAGIKFTHAAAENIREAGISDRAVRHDASTMTREAEEQGLDGAAESMLAICLDGADDDRHEGWRDYVAALKAHVVLDADLHALGEEAHQAGDYKMRAMAYRALGEGHNPPNKTDRAECERIIREARAKT